MFDWSKYAVGGAQRPDSFTGLNPDFATALSQMLLAAETDLGPNALSITSAYRSPEKQAELYEAALEKYGSPAVARKWVAPPGGSMHNKGLAVDFGAAGGGLLRDPNSREAQWLKANAANFGLDVPMSWEPWQVELAGARGGEKIADEAMSLLGKGPQTPTKGPQMMQEQKPQGLLGSLGIQKMEEGAEGETGQRFYQRDSFKDTAAVLAQGFGRMGIMGMEEIADGIAKQRTEAKARNKTAEYLRKAGRGDLADMVDQGLIGGREAAGVLLQKPADDRTAAMQNFAEYNRIAAEQGKEAADRFLEMTRKGSVTNLNIPGEPTIGTIPQGFQAIQDPQTGAYRLEVLEGGPAAAEAEESVAKEALRGAQESRSAGVVLENVQAVKDKLESTLLPVTGIGGSLLKQIPGTNAYDVSGLVKTIRGNIGFDRLQQMRDASPTGGALGQVAVQELEMLQSVLGNLDQAQSEEQFLANLNRVESIYSDIMRKAAAYPNAAEFGFGGATSARSDDPLGLRN